VTAGVAGHGDEVRPDGRAVSAETARLRLATRTLRYHLDELPIDYRLDMPGDRYLAGLAFMFARQRYDCADSMIGQASAARSWVPSPGACSSTGRGGCTSVSSPGGAAHCWVTCWRSATASAQC